MSKAKDNLKKTLTETTRQAMEQCLSDSPRTLDEKEALEAVVEAAEDVLDSWQMRLDELEEE